MRFEHGNSSVYNLGYHIIFVPKYRKSILKGEIKNIVEKSLYEKAKELCIKVENYEIMPDHIHIFLKTKPTISVSYIVGQFKGYSSYKVRSAFPQYRKYKALWSPSYYCESVGHISEPTIKKYIETQWERY